MLVTLTFDNLFRDQVGVLNARSMAIKLKIVDLHFMYERIVDKRVILPLNPLRALITPHCLRCGGDHGSDSFDCPAYSFEKEVIAAATTEKISMRVARKRLGSRYVSEGISYAQILKPNVLPLVE